MATLTPFSTTTPANSSEMNSRMQELNAAKPDKGVAEVITGQFNFANGVGVGGVVKTAWPTAVAGSNGTVFSSGSVTLAGADGVVVTHNRGATDYLVKVTPDTLAGLSRVGDVVVVRAANTCTIYNSGASGITARVELSVVA
ncbi:MAG: hypothetical protein ABSD47_01060 [Candidatus Methylomirabilota bacterium]|jgi:hypothetical protein